MLPPLIRKLFSNNGIGDKLRQEIIPYLDASILKTGKINPNLLPDLAYNILYRVDSIGKMYVLTTNEVQNFDFVLVNDDELYMVVDDTKLTTTAGYLFLLSLKNFNGGIPASSDTATRLAKAITIELTGLIEAKQTNWNGTSNISLSIDSIKPEGCHILYPVKTISTNYTVLENDLNNIICIDTPGITITLQKIEINGWNCFIKNISSSTASIKTVNNDIYINTGHSIALAPRCVIHFISNGNNGYVTIDNTPTIILE